MLCDKKNKFVYEISEFFGNELTVEEMEYWMVYNLINSAEKFGVDCTGLTFGEVTKAIENKANELKDKANNRRS